MKSAVQVNYHLDACCIYYHAGPGFSLYSMTVDHRELSPHRRQMHEYKENFSCSLGWNNDIISLRSITEMLGKRMWKRADSAFVRVCYAAM